MNIDQQLGLRLSYIKDNPKSWKDATDEVRELARAVRIMYNEMVLDVCEDDDQAVPGINWRKIKSPGEWNRVYKAQIRELWAKLPEWAKEDILNQFQL